MKVDYRGVHPRVVLVSSTPNGLGFIFYNMAKDPAFLFYPNDYIGGTMGMTFEQKGAYVELLMTQFNRGHMTTHMIGQVLGHNSGQLWDVLKLKFTQDADGLYYNERLEVEQNKRKAYTNSRRKNIDGVNQYSKTKIEKVGHMTSHMENENVNENINTNKKGGAGGKNMIAFDDFDELKRELLESSQWIETTAMRHKITPDDVRGFIETFCLDQRAKEPGARLLGDYKRHCVNWIGSQLERNEKASGKQVKKNLTYLELSELASKGMAKFSDYEIQKDKTWKLKSR